MKKMIALLICVSLLFAAAGCFFGNNGDDGPDVAHDTPAPTAVPTPTPAPTPTPEPRLLFAGETWKAEVFESLLVEDEIVPELYSDLDTLLAAGPFPGLTVVALYQDAPLDTGKVAGLVQQGVKVVVFEAGNPVIGGATVIPYAGTGTGIETTRMMEATLTFPPHDTPVRLLGMFSGSDSAAHKLWSQNVSEGKIFSRATFTGGNAADWTDKMLDLFQEGLLDAVFCETAALAEVMTRALAARGRI
ncbi:MAG: hypothetical protein FWE69_08535, partial [Clostridiales bacterium]|nr:hypothetical protein [Clostridiales bacterium]